MQPRSVSPTFTSGKEKSDEGEQKNHITVYEDFHAASDSQAIHGCEDGFLPVSGRNSAEAIRGAEFPFALSVPLATLAQCLA